MSIQQVKSPYNVFTDSDGTPLESGYIYIGEQNKNAKTYPVSVYWDENLTIPAAQPIRTIGGYPSRNGNVSQVFVNESYSLRVENKNQVLIFNDESVNVESYSSLEIDSFLDDKADKSNVLELDNLEEFTPDSDYEPATKKYVDDADILKADKDNVLELDNLVEFTPTELYHPTTKKYVDDNAYEDDKVKTLFNINSLIDDAPVYACRAWVNFNGTETVAIRGSGNVSSITDLGTGNYRMNFAISMEDDNFAAIVNHNQELNYGQAVRTYREDASSSFFEFQTEEYSSGPVNPDIVAVAIFR